MTQEELAEIREAVRIKSLPRKLRPPSAKARLLEHIAEMEAQRDATTAQFVDLRARIGSITLLHGYLESLCDVQYLGMNAKTEDNTRQMQGAQSRADIYHKQLTGHEAAIADRVARSFVYVIDQMREG